MGCRWTKQRCELEQNNDAAHQCAVQRIARVSIRLNAACPMSLLAKQLTPQQTHNGL